MLLGSNWVVPNWVFWTLLVALFDVALVVYLWWSDRDG